MESYPSALFAAAGGVGLFLLGMIVMTDALKKLAGGAMRKILVRFTKSPYSGAAAGAAVTAMMQSSSATTVTAIGFVAAGLLTFPQALGILFGANIGTTVTGWLVALLGFTFHLGAVALPLVFAGAVLHLFGKRRLAALGLALAGFALIFLGIETIMEGMKGLRGMLDFQALPGDTLGGRALLVLIGIVFTVVTFSSGAGVAAALSALYVGTISFEQAAALVIGMDIGTTVKAVIATLGGSVSVRRTGYSHVVYNLFTGLFAFALISPYIYVLQTFAPSMLAEHAEISLVAFHTLFNVVGVLAVLPFTYPFARFINRLVPKKALFYLPDTDDSLLSQPTLALNAAREMARNELVALLYHLSAILGDPRNGRREDLEQLQGALDETHAYLDRIHLSLHTDANWQRLVALIHTMDHLQRLHERCEEEEGRARTSQSQGVLSDAHDRLVLGTASVTDAVTAERWFEAATLAQKTFEAIEKEVEPVRASVMLRIANGEIDVPEGTAQLEAIRWLKRVAFHIARATRHYADTVLSGG